MPTAAMTPAFPGRVCLAAAVSPSAAALAAANSEASSLHTDKCMVFLAAQCLKACCILGGQRQALQSAHLDGGVHHFVASGYRPVDEVQVEVLQLQVLQGLPAGL